ncbi:MAG: DUF6495 family protein [Vicingaceae bacterium]
MKYRCLTYQEFDILATDFNDFLYSEGINTFEWSLLQDQYSDDALDLLRKYSDLIFDKLIKGVHYLEYRTKKQLLLYECRENDYTIIGIEIPEMSKINLTDIKSIEAVSKKDLHACKSFKLKFPYKNSREQEIFEFIEDGFYIVDEKAFKKINLFRQTYLN